MSAVHLEVAKEVYAKLWEQNGRSLSDNGHRCLYRSSDGLKCAVGFLVPDELYDPKMEDLALGEIFDEHAAGEYLKRKYPGLEYEFLFKLQRVHDEARGSCFRANIADAAWSLSEFLDDAEMAKIRLFVEQLRGAR